jgi:hypothetical protein
MQDRAHRPVHLALPSEGEREQVPIVSEQPARPASAAPDGEPAPWLLSAAPDPAHARAHWADAGVAWLRPGLLFTAVIVQASVMHRAVGKPGPQECAQVLAGLLDGPVFYRIGEFGPDGGYTVLLPASAMGIWRVRGTVVLPPNAQFLVPAPHRQEPAADSPWWVVTPSGPDGLCTPALLASLLARRTAATGGQGAGHA